jgi:hypothetical protein
MNMDSEKPFGMSFLMRIRQRFSAYRNFIPTLVAATVVHFNNHEDTKAAFERQPPEHKKPTPQGQPRKPNIKFYEERHPRQPSQGAGAWQGSNRGGANAPSVAAIRVVLVTAKVTEDEVASAVVADAAEEENEENEVGEVDGRAR